MKIESSELTVASTYAEYLGYIKLNLDKTKAEELVMYFDDIELTKVVEEPVDPDGPEVPMTDNAGFEVSDATAACGAAGWGLTNDDNYGYFSRTTDKFYHGTASMKFSVPSGATKVPYIISTDLRPVTKGNNYKVSCWMYVEKVGQLKSVDLIASNMKWQSTAINKADIPIGQWVKLESAEFTPTNAQGEEANGNIKLAVRPNIVGATFAGADGEIILYIDNVAANEVADDATSLDNLNQSDLCVCGSQGALRIANVLVGDKVTVYNTTGQLVNTTIATSSNLSIPLQSGIYIVRVGTEARKVTL